MPNTTQWTEHSGLKRDKSRPLRHSGHAVFPSCGQCQISRFLSVRELGRAENEKNDVSAMAEMRKSAKSMFPPREISSRQTTEGL